MTNDVEVTNFTCNGICSNCGQCCGDLLHLSKREIKAIDLYLKKHKVVPTKPSIMVFYDNTCPFRDTTNKTCKIYPVRPDICKVYKCDKSKEEIYNLREATNKNKLLRSMRNIFFNDNEHIKRAQPILNLKVFDRENKLIK